MTECMWFVTTGDKAMITPGRTFHDAKCEMYRRIEGTTGKRIPLNQIAAKPFQGNGEDYTVLKHDIKDGYEIVTYARKLEDFEIERRKNLVLD